MNNILNKRKSSGIFIQRNGRFEEYKGDVGKGSINEIIETLGYHIDQIYSPILKSGKDKILYVGFEIFSRNLVFVLTSKDITYITHKDINKYLKEFSVRKEFDRLRTTDLLTECIENKSLTVDFLSKVLNLKDFSKSGIFFSDKLDIYLYFTEGVLTDFHFDDGLFPYAKHLKSVNPIVYNWIANLANKYWPNNSFQAIKEINIQCEAWANIPEAFGNEFIPLHRTENGGANLHMIRVCHYDYPIKINQFIEVNHGRYEELEDTDLNKVYRCGNFIYTFNKESEQLLKVKLTS